MVPKNLIKQTIQPSNCTWAFILETENLGPYRYPYTIVYSSFVCKCPKLETTKMILCKRKFRTSFGLAGPLHESLLGWKDAHYWGTPQFGWIPVTLCWVKINRPLKVTYCMKNTTFLKIIELEKQISGCQGSAWWQGAILYPDPGGGRTGGHEWLGVEKLHARRSRARLLALVECSTSSSSCLCQGNWRKGL